MTFLDTTTNTTLGTAALNGNTATVSTTLLTAGQHNITATYAGDANFSTSTSSATALTQTVNQAATTTSLTAATPDPSTFGQSLTFTATVTPTAPGTGTPTGSVRFEDGTTTLGTGTLANGAATFTTSALSVVGSPHSITAVYGGDTNFLASPASPAVSQTVEQAGSTVTLTSSPNPASPGQTVTLTATVAAVSPGTGTPTGSVTFLDTTTNTTLGTADLNAGSATLPTSFTAVADHSITATYNGDASFTSSSGTVTVPVSETSSLTGYAYMDVNDNGQRMVSGVSKLGIPNVTVTLERTDATAPNQTALTQSDGSFQFNSLPAGTYTLVETQPQQYLNVKDAQAGSFGGDVSIANTISGISLPAGQQGTEYDFGEYLLAQGYLSNQLELASTPTASDPVIERIVDPPPVVQLGGNSTTNFTATYAVGGSPVAIASPAATITHAGGGNLSTLTVTITNSKDADSEGFVIGNQTFNAGTVSPQTVTTLTSFPKITAVFAAGVLTLTGDDSVADYQSLLQSIQYEDTATSPDTSPRIITVVANEALAASNTATTTINISDPPPSATASRAHAAAVVATPVADTASGASLADQVLGSVDNWLGQ